MQLRPKRPRSRAAVLSLTIPVALVALSAAQAKGGELDSRFDGDGKAIVDFGGPERARLLRPPWTGSSVARLNADGTLDSSFGTAGKVVTDLGTASTPNAVAIEGDGKIVVAGSIAGPSGLAFLVARYSDSGALDTTFGSGGVVVTELGRPAAARALAIQADGKIVAAGYSRVAERITLAAPSDFAIARYSADGSLDPTFGSGGTTTLSFGEGMHARAEGVALGSDGTIAVAGWAKPTSTGGGFGGSDFAVARLTAAGASDTGFDDDGRTLTDFGAVETAEDVVVTPDGKVVLVGWGEHAALARYRPDGSLDATFGDAGKVSAAAAAFFNATALDAKGRVVAAGASASGEDFVVARYLPGGRLDGRFGGGATTTDFGANDSAEAVAVASDGTIVAAGRSAPPEALLGDFVVARYLPTRCVVPKVVGKSRASARASLVAAGCQTGTVRSGYSRKIKRGRVISQKPRAGMDLAEDAKVNLVVSRGRKR